MAEVHDAENCIVGAESRREAAAVGPWVDLAVISGGGKPISSQCPVGSTLILRRTFLRQPSSLASAVEPHSGTKG